MSNFILCFTLYFEKGSLLPIESIRPWCFYLFRMRYLCHYHKKHYAHQIFGGMHRQSQIDIGYYLQWKKINFFSGYASEFSGWNIIEIYHG